jgi:hypothetical protein
VSEKEYHDPEFWRRLADEALAESREVTDREIKTRLLNIAHYYEAIAEHVQELSSLLADAPTQPKGHE